MQTLPLKNQKIIGGRLLHLAASWENKGLTFTDYLMYSSKVREKEPLDNDTHTPLYYAIQNDNLEVVKCIVNHLIKKEWKDSNWEERIKDHIPENYNNVTGLLKIFLDSPLRPRRIRNLSEATALNGESKYTYLYICFNDSLASLAEESYVNF